VVAVVVASPPSNAALLGPVKEAIFQFAEPTSVEEELTAPAPDDAPTTIILVRRVFVNLHPFIILPRKSLRGLLAWWRAHGYNGRLCVLR
jgi:hypothetical protein